MKKQILCAMLALASLVTTVTSVSFAGNRVGPVRSIENVRAFSTDSYHVTFVGGEDAAVLVDGDGDTDLDLYVYDANGNLIGCDTDYTDTCLVRFTPRWAGVFTIHVVNRGGISNSYLIATN